jgi:hypothetical protein
VPDDTLSGGGCKGKEFRSCRSSGVAEWEIANQRWSGKQKTENRSQNENGKAIAAFGPNV